MQCHRCPKNGRPDEGCISCKCAEYLDNDHKTVTPVSDVSVLPVETPAPKHRFSVPAEVVRDCLDVVETLKHCGRRSFPYLLKIFLAFASLGPGAGFLQHVLCGGTFTTYAEGEGITRQAAMQKWNRMSKAVPEIECVARRRKGGDNARRILEEDEE